MNQFAVHLKLIQHCKSTTIKKKKKSSSASVVGRIIALPKYSHPCLGNLGDCVTLRGTGKLGLKSN